MKCPANLQEAKQAMAERYWAIALEEAARHDVTIKRFRPSLSGKAFVSQRTITAPRPRTRRRLRVFLHEVGHIALGHSDPKPRYVAEQEADEWAFETMRRHGIRVRRRRIEDVLAEGPFL